MQTFLYSFSQIEHYWHVKFSSLLLFYKQYSYNEVPNRISNQLNTLNANSDELISLYFLRSFCKRIVCYDTNYKKFIFLKSDWRIQRSIFPQPDIKIIYQTISDKQNAIIGHQLISDSSVTCVYGVISVDKISDC